MVQVCAAVPLVGARDSTTLLWHLRRYLLWRRLWQLLVVRCMWRIASATRLLPGANSSSLVQGREVLWTGLGRLLLNRGGGRGLPCSHASLRWILSMVVRLRQCMALVGVMVDVRLPVLNMGLVAGLGVLHRQLLMLLRLVVISAV